MLCSKNIFCKQITSPAVQELWRCWACSNGPSSAYGQVSQQCWGWRSAQGKAKHGTHSEGTDKEQPCKHHSQGRRQQWVLKVLRARQPAACTGSTLEQGAVSWRPCCLGRMHARSGKCVRIKTENRGAVRKWEPALLRAPVPLTVGAGTKDPGKEGGVGKVGT